MNKDEKYPSLLIKQVNASIACYELSKIKNPTHKQTKNFTDKLIEYAYHHKEQIYETN